MASAQASAQAFYVTAVEADNAPQAMTAAFESTLPGAARSCVPRRAGRRFAPGVRVLIVEVGADGRATTARVRADDISPSAHETAFGRCLEDAARAVTFPRPAAQPAVVEFHLEYARSVPSALASGGSGVRRGPRAQRGPTPQDMSGPGLPADQVRAFVQQRSEAVQRCIPAGETRPLDTEVLIWVRPDGTVEAINTSRASVSPAFDSCVTQAMQTASFPAPGRRSMVRIPIRIGATAPTQQAPAQQAPAQQAPAQQAPAQQAPAQQAPAQQAPAQQAPAQQAPAPR